MKQWWLYIRKVEKERERNIHVTQHIDYINFLLAEESYTLRESTDMFLFKRSPLPWNTSMGL